MSEEDIKMNSFPAASDANYIYAEASNGSQIKISKSDLIKIPVFDNMCNSYTSDLNKTYKDVNDGMSLFIIDANVANSPFPYGECIHIQRQNKGVVSASQIIMQVVFGNTQVKIRNGYGNGTTIVYTEWRTI